MYVQHSQAALGSSWRISAEPALSSRTMSTSIHVLIYFCVCVTIACVPETMLLDDEGVGDGMILLCI